MTLNDAIRFARANKGHIYTTDELWMDDENCILINHLGTLIFSDGEPVTDESALPADGWYDITDVEEQYHDDVSSTTYDRVTNDMFIDSVLWDAEDN